MGIIFSSPEERKRQRGKAHLKKQYNGSLAWSGLKRYQRPTISDENLEARIYELPGNKDGNYGKRTYLNPYYNEKEKYPDIDAYYSTTRMEPRRLVVQATDHVLKNDHGIRHRGQCRIKGKIPLVIKLTELCLNPLGYDKYDGVDDESDSESGGGKKSLSVWRRVLHWLLSSFLIMTVAWIIQMLITIEGVFAPWTEDNEYAEPYEGYDNMQWYWPKHAINPLDEAPKRSAVSTTPRISGIAYLNLPRRLVVKDDSTQEWVVREAKDIRDPISGTMPPYIFISYTGESFGGYTNPALRRQRLHHIAEQMVASENQLHKDQPEIKAFWLDLVCIIKKDTPPDEINKDVYSICDAVRGAVRVYIVLQSNTDSEKEKFGQRVWTLPEALLGVGKMRYCFPSSVDKEEGKFNVRNLLLTDMYGSFWQSHEGSRPEWAGKEQDSALGLLVKHYSNTLRLTDLQLFSCIVQALAEKSVSKINQPTQVGGYTQAAVAYAAMAMLSYQIEPDETETNFEAIARLSLVNDSDQLLERLACQWPTMIKAHDDQAGWTDAVAGSEKLIRRIAEPDAYYTHLWDIKPLCQVVGVCDEEDTPTIMLDRCRAIPIRWKSFPRLNYNTRWGFRTTMASLVLQCGCGFFFLTSNVLWGAISLGFSQLNSNGINMSYYLIGAAVLFICGWLISLFCPRVVRRLCNDCYTGGSRYLVGFEGTMRLRDIEFAMFGTYGDRLRYAPSSTPMAGTLRDDYIRKAREPGPADWERLYSNIPADHRVFTIVDTTDCTVSLIVAERPPVVALICGREGGMVRALLCSWRFENNCLYREYVMRMRSSVEDFTTPMDWLKVSLASQGEVSRVRVRKYLQGNTVNGHGH